MRKKHEVLVAGGGPVGLFAALSLHERDVHVAVVDAEWERPVRGHACGLHPATLRALSELGLLPALLPRGHAIDRLSVYRGHELAGQVNFTGLGEPFPHVLALRQSDLEEVLGDALARRDVSIAWRQEVTDVQLDSGSIRVASRQKHLISNGEPASRAEELGRQTKLREVDYLIGADGLQSFCRNAIDAQLVQVGPASAFAVCEFLCDLSGWEHEARIILMPDSVSAFWPLGPNLGRWTFQIWEHLDQPPTLDALCDWIDVRAPWFAPKPEQLCWGAVADFEQRVSSSFGAGRIWLAGDAAHTSVPLGFHSMNRGFAEARDLALAIASELHGGIDEEERFRAFDQRHQAEWRRLFGLSALLVGRGATELPDAARLVSALPASGRDLDRMLAALGLRFEGGPPSLPAGVARWP